MSVRELSHISGTNSTTEYINRKCGGFCLSFTGSCINSWVNDNNSVNCFMIM